MLKFLYLWISSQFIDHLKGIIVSLPKWNLVGVPGRSPLENIVHFRGYTENHISSCITQKIKMSGLKIFYFIHSKMYIFLTQLQKYFYSYMYEILRCYSNSKQLDRFFLYYSINVIHRLLQSIAVWWPSFCDFHVLKISLNFDSIVWQFFFSKKRKNIAVFLVMWINLHILCA